MSYQQPYKLRHFPIEDGRFAGVIAFEDELAGPVFPFLLEADFSTYEGFLEFVDTLGLDGLGWFSDKLKRQLDAKWKSASAGYSHKPFGEKWLKSIWREIKERLTEEQKAVTGLFELQQQLQKEGKARVIDANMRVGRGGGIAFAEGLPHEPLFEPYGSLKRVARILVEQVHLDVEVDEQRILGRTQIVGKMDVAAEGHAAVFVQEVPASGFKDAIKYSWRYDSVIARCYAELAALINDGKAVKPCRSCHKYFVPTRSNEKYCERGFYDQVDKFAQREYEELLQRHHKQHDNALKVAQKVTEPTRVAAGPQGVSKPGFGAEWTSRGDLDRLDDPEYRRRKALVGDARTALKELRHEQRDELRAFLNRHTCKKIGRQKTFKANNADYSREYQRLWQQTNKAKKEHGQDSPEYKKAAAALANLKKAKSKTRKGDHG